VNLRRKSTRTSESVRYAQESPQRSSSIEVRRFGRASTQVPVIGQGTWYIDRADRASAIAALRLGIDRGMSHIDTAELYGAAEEVIAQAIEGRRDEVFLVSKVLPQNASVSGTIAACERSLARLRTDWLDCYLLHWRGSFPLDDTIEAFERLKRDGKILCWGVSNFDVPDLKEAWKIAGDARMACNQVLYHLQERAIEQRVIPWCEAHDVAVVGYSPFAHGKFPRPGTAGGRVLREIAAAHAATPRQVALRFLTRRPPLFTIPKAGKPEHASENARAGALELSAAEIARIDAAFPVGPPRQELPVI
jgi:diketogulonate reductase-like aldo/keto reductase